MEAIIKSSQVDPILAKSVARLSLANKHLQSQLAGRDFQAIMQAMRVVRSSIFWFKEASEASEQNQENAVLSAKGIAMSIAGEKLCKDSAEGIRLFFEVIPGGR